MIEIHRHGLVTTIAIARPQVRNAVDHETAHLLFDAFSGFEQDASARVAVLTSVGNHFCSGADLKAISNGNFNPLLKDGPAPMGPSRLALTKPVIAAIEGYAVAGGLELALWCDLRVASSDAVLGVFCRRWGVPLIDGGTVRLPRIIGLGRALDLILTGRPVKASEAFDMGLVNRVVAPGTAQAEAEALALSIAQFPNACMLTDRRSVYEHDQHPMAAALLNELANASSILNESVRAGAQRFTDGAGRSGRFDGEFET